MVVRKESSKKQQTYEAKANLGKICVIDFCLLKNHEFLPLSDRSQKRMRQKNCCDGGSVIVESVYQRKEELDEQSLNCIARSKCF